MCFFHVADVLRGFKAISEELHPSLHWHQEPLPLPAVESAEARLRVHRHQPVLRLLCHGHHSVQLHIPGHDGDR